MDAVYVTDRDGNIVAIGKGVSEGEARQKALIERRRIVEKTGNPWGRYRFSRLIEID